MQKQLAYAPELVTLVSSFTPVLAGLKTQPYTEQSSETK